MSDSDFLRFKMGDEIRYPDGRLFGIVTDCSAHGRIPVKLPVRPKLLMRDRLRNLRVEFTDRIEAIWHIAWHGDGRYYEHYEDY